MASVDMDSGEAVSLNLMPMMDIFSILITFLLMSYSTDPVNYDITSGLELPISFTLDALDEIPVIVVTKSEIKINDRKVASVIAGDVPENQREQGAVYPVFKALEELAESNKRLIRRSGTDAEKDKNITSTLSMEMDKDHRFKLMKRIMLAAQQAEFITFKMLVDRQSE